MNYATVNNVQLFNDNWLFTLNKVDAPHLLQTDDSDWNEVTLPHDWSIELGLDLENGAGCTGFYPGGIGWYRKHFITTQQMKDKIVTIWFDGVYNNADFYLNGNYIGFHPYGYSPICYDLTKFLNDVGEENLLSVRVDHSRFADSRWYTGSGIFRNVRLIVKNKIHIPVWGSYITTPCISTDSALVNLDLDIENMNLTSQKVTVNTQILSQGNEIIANCQSKLTLNGNDKYKIAQKIRINNPELWDIDNPYLYRAKTILLCNDEIIDQNITTFGIRSFVFDKDEGFFLNGKHKLIKGVCLHHEAGIVGGAVPDDVWIRRLNILKECGCNAIRTSHNPVSQEFLDLCDKMGFLVQAEFYDEWDIPKGKKTNGYQDSMEYSTQGHSEHFQKWAKIDLQNSMLRDRNHPSIIQWSIGNEIEWTYTKYNFAAGYGGANAGGGYFYTMPPYTKEQIKTNIKNLPEDKYEIGKTARKLSYWTREMDTTRPVTANCIFPSASYESGLTDALDIVGFSYRRVVYDYAHTNYPEKPIIGNENVAQWHEWKAILDRKFISGLFLWTGIDYLGEVRNKKTGKGTSSGLLDLAGFKKTSFYLFKSLWTDEPMVHIETQTLENSVYKLKNNQLCDKEGQEYDRRRWYFYDMNRHWNYDENEKCVVEVYSNCESVELFCNNKSYSIKFLKDMPDHCYKWCVPFQAGEIIAKGLKQGVEVSEKIITSGQPTKIKLTTDKTTLNCSVGEVAHIVAQLYDKNDNIVTNVEQEIEFSIDGNCKLLGVDNGSIYNLSDYKSNKVMTHFGKCLLLIQADEISNLTITARSDEIAQIKPIKIKSLKVL